MDTNNKLANKTTDGKVIIAMLAMVGGLIMIYISLVFYAFNWRVANEPGYSTMWGLLIPAIAFCGIGGLVFLWSNIYLLIRRSVLIFLAWALCVLVTIGAASLAPFLLLFMV
jgi:hypothetical protein